MPRDMTPEWPPRNPHRPPLPPVDAQKPEPAKPVEAKKPEPEPPVVEEEKIDAPVPAKPSRAKWSRKKEGK